MAARTGGKSRLERSDWAKAASDVLATKGVEAVRVESLARDLHVSKGSFYWHFRNHSELLETVLDFWEERQGDWNVGHEGEHRTPAELWANLLELLSQPGIGELDLAVFSWARRDEHVAQRVSAVERKRVAYLSRVFREVGFAKHQAEEWSHAAMLLYIGYIQSARSASANEDAHPLAEILSRFLLAASALASQETLRQ